MSIKELNVQLETALEEVESAKEHLDSTKKEYQEASLAYNDAVLEFKKLRVALNDEMNQLVPDSMNDPHVRESL